MSVKSLARCRTESYDIDFVSYTNHSRVYIGWGSFEGIIDHFDVGLGSEPGLVDIACLCVDVVGIQLAGM